MNPVNAVAVPADSDIARHLRGAHFFDAYEAALPDGRLSALEIYLSVVSRTPGWVERLMSTRNRVVGWFGLKNLGSLGAIDRAKPASAYRIGDRVGIFTIHSLSEREVVFADSDRHLDAKISVCKTGSAERPAAAVSTVVHIHNLLGHVYIFFVGPVHKLIVPAMLRRLPA
ncbi:DUF2867 domain-containing protein [Aquincola sp. S2]|uniref:DUF2867 domain-containing protein n=1 Tax=Pseudaquabacterium terrae TaxID=2732868 RepID=A0ABX2ENX5_9BURK|nr:DUF2867 domain-containing protein [Aquabacterium terrae]NRF70273.1 DUF2867 domain-containing protein [Aquabacterium terrae]